MTNDEMETRIERLETRVTALTALVHCIVPAIPPASRERLLQQFRQYCGSTESQIHQDDLPAHVSDFHLGLLAEMYTSLQGAIQLTNQHDRHTES